MPTINASATISIAAGTRLVLDAGGQAAATLLHAASGQPLQSIDIGRSAQAVGPFSYATALSVAAVRPVSYSAQTVPFETYESSDAVPVRQDPATGALVGAAGVIAYPASAGDVLRQSASVAPVASAISTTVAVAIAIPAQSTKVRIAWQGRGSAGAAAGTARLNIACNRENLTAGLVASQDARRRDYQLAAGEAVVLQSATPITVLHCSANESVSANTHGIQVSYE